MPQKIIDKNTLHRGNIVDYIADIFLRRGAESYLGEAVTMSEHMLQAAQNAQIAGESDHVVVAALLHDIGHYSGEFPEDYIEQGIDNQHQTLGADVLTHFFPPNVVEPVRWHVEAKRYLCAVDPQYIESLSQASIDTLKLQGGPFNDNEVTEFRKNPYLASIIRVRKYDDAAKDPAVTTPSLDHYLPMLEKLVKP